MIIQCEKCATRFKVADDKVTPQGIKVRCSKCQHVFTARAGDGNTMPTGAASRPSGIFAAPDSPASPSRSSSNPPSSGSVSVPQASLRQDPSFDPFAPPRPLGGAPRSSPGSGGLSFELEDAPAAPGDRSFFGAPNQTIGGFDDDDVPAPPRDEPPPTPSLRGRGPPTPTPTPTGDPFAAGLHGVPSADPFAAPPSADGDKTAAFVDPFAATSGPSAAAAFPAAGDPFAAQASADPFAAAAAAAQGSFGPPGADPFRSDETAPFSPSSSGSQASATSSNGEDPFSGLGVDVDPYAVDVDEPPPPPPVSTAPPPAPPPIAAPPPVVAKPDAASQKTRAAKKRARIPAAVPRAAWAVAQACILAAFLTLSLVWVRGGTLDDISEGQALEVVLGRASNQGAGQGPLRVDDVVVARRPVDVAPDLVVVSGYVVNGDVEHPAVRVTVRFGEGKAEAGWANSVVDGVDLATATSPEALLALNDRVPEDPHVKPGARAPFVVLVRGAPDGAKADVNVEVTKPPAPPPPVEVTPPAGEKDDGKGKALRRRPRRGQGKVEGRLDDGEGASARPRARRAREQD